MAAELRRRLVIDVFKAIGDPSRAAILASLAEAEGPLRVGEIGTCCPQDLSVVSRHLRILRDAGVVEAERQGREVRYWIRTGELVKLLRDLADALEACCSEDEGSSLAREVQ
jgi:ArsR family transcriptional regulator